jgi:hypothetical protein
MDTPRLAAVIIAEAWHILQKRSNGKCRGGFGEIFSSNGVDNRGPGA